jgi:hypothetical protein
LKSTNIPGFSLSDEGYLTSPSHSVFFANNCAILFIFLFIFCSVDNIKFAFVYARIRHSRMEGESENRMPRNFARNQSSIQQILHQVKSGQRDKSEAFSELRNILTSSARRNSHSNYTADGNENIEGNRKSKYNSDQNEHGNELDNASLSSTGPVPARFSQEDRKLLINRLIEKKKHIIGPPIIPPPPPLPHEEVNHPEPSYEVDNSFPLDGSGYNNNRYTPRTGMGNISGMGEDTAGLSSIAGDDQNNMTINDDYYSQRRGRPRSRSAERGVPQQQQQHPQHYQHQQYQQQMQMQPLGPYGEPNEMDENEYNNGFGDDGADGAGGGGGNNNNNNGSVGTSISNPYRGDARSNRMAQSEAAIRMEAYKECTFQPAVKELPEFYGGYRQDRDKSTSFYDRAMKWKEEKANDTFRREQSLNQSYQVECPFHPRLNRNSERAAREVRGNFSHEDTNERLFRQSEYAIMQRNKFIETELMKARQQEDQHCSFQPKLMTPKLLGDQEVRTSSFRFCVSLLVLASVYTFILLT